MPGVPCDDELALPGSCSNLTQLQTCLYGQCRIVCASNGDCPPGLLCEGDTAGVDRVRTCL